MTQVGKRPVRRVLVAIDVSPGSFAAAAAAARISAALRADLVGLFVEDFDLVELGAAAHAHLVGLDGADARRVSGPEIERQLRVQATRARRALDSVAAREGVTATFRVSRGAVTRELLAAASPEDLVSVGRIGWSHGRRRRLGSTVRALLERRPGLVLLLEKGDMISPPPGVLFDGGERAAEALELAARLARPEAGGLVVFVTGAEAHEEAMRQLGPQANLTRFEPGERAASLITAVARLRVGLLVLPVGGPGLAAGDLPDLLTSLRCPAIVVN